MFCFNLKSERLGGVAVFKASARWGALRLRGGGQFHWGGVGAGPPEIAFDVGDPFFKIYGRFASLICLSQLSLFLFLFLFFNFRKGPFCSPFNWGGGVLS